MNWLLAAAAGLSIYGLIVAVCGMLAHRRPVRRCVTCGSATCHGGFSCPRWPNGWGNPL